MIPPPVEVVKEANAELRKGRILAESAALVSAG